MKTKLRIPVFIIVLALMTVLYGIEQAFADDVIPPVYPGTPPAIIALADGLHILDNGTVLMLRDVRNGVYGTGSSTTIYKKYYLSGDGLIGYIPEVPGSNSFYAISGRFWAGQFLYEQVPQVKALADATGLTAKMLQYGTVGYWGARDFQVGIWRHGWDAGVAIKF